MGLSLELIDPHLPLISPFPVPQFPHKDGQHLLGTMATQGVVPRVPGTVPTTMGILPLGY